MANDIFNRSQPLEGGGSSDDAPWARVHRAALARRTASSEGKYKGGRLTALPPGHLVAWDLNGFTGRINGMSGSEQIEFLQTIVHAAVEMAKDLGLVMLAAPAGDQGVYYAPPSVPVNGVIEYLNTGLGLNPVKAVVLPIPEQALFVATLFDQNRVRGCHGLTGPAYARALQGLTVVRVPTVLGPRQYEIFRRFPEFDLEAPPPPLDPQEKALLDRVTRPMIPGDRPHCYGIIGLSKDKGLDLRQPSRVLEVARALFNEVPDVSIHRLDEGRFHFTTEEGGSSGFEPLSNLVSVCGRLSLSVHAKFVPRAPVLEAYGMRDVAGGAVVDLARRGKPTGNRLPSTRHVRGEVDATQGVAPFVVVPG